MKQMEKKAQIMRWLMYLQIKIELYQFLAGLSGMTEKEIAALPLGTFTQMIVDVFKKEEFSDFFQVVSGLLK